jgi:hypothetical protein
LPEVANLPARLEFVPQAQPGWFMKLISPKGTAELLGNELSAVPLELTMFTMLARR